jgi:hypothetical protein
VQILHLVELARKPAEIVNRPRRRHDGDAEVGNEPMGGDRQDRFGLADFLPDAPPARGVAVVAQRIHRIAVPEEDCGERISHGERLASWKDLTKYR